MFNIVPFDKFETYWQFIQKALLHLFVNFFMQLPNGVSNELYKIILFESIWGFFK